MAGEAFLYVGTAVIDEDMIDIIMGGGCGGGCHWIENKKEERSNMFCRDRECGLNLNIFVWMIKSKEQPQND
jgi:hypothetical protein